MTPLGAQYEVRPGPLATPCHISRGKPYGTNGYVRIMREGKYVRAHRYVYERDVGPIPPGWHLHHRCEARACINADHLQPLPPGAHALLGDTGPAQNARKTHCIHGHALVGANAYVNARGERHCRRCHRRWQREHRMRKAVRGGSR